MIYKTLQRKQKNEQYELHYKPGLNSGAPEGLAVPVPHVTPVVVLLNGTNIHHLTSKLCWTQVNVNKYEQHK